MLQRFLALSKPAYRSRDGNVLLLPLAVLPPLSTLPPSQRTSSSPGSGPTPNLVRDLCAKSNTKPLQRPYSGYQERGAVPLNSQSESTATGSRLLPRGSWRSAVALPVSTPARVRGRAALKAQGADS
eukprot:360489-Rhodomonas_salina.1